MTSFDAFVHIAPIVTMRGTPECVEYYRAFLEEMRQRVADNVAATPGEEFRLGWDNIPIWFKLGGLSKRLAQHKACLVVATYTDAWAVDLSAADRTDILRQLSKVYTTVYINCGMKRRLQIITDMAEKYALDGVILHSNRSCKAYSFGQYDIAQILQDRYDIPALVLEGDMNDSRSYSEEQANNRIDAFMETLSARKH